MDPLVWSVLLCFIMAVLVAMEMFTPSFGVLTVCSLGAMAGSVATAFRHSASAGFAMIGVNLTLFPMAVLVAMQFMKKSPLLLDKGIHGREPKAPDRVPDAPSRQALVGQRGRALTTLRPAGTIQVGEERIAVVTEGKFVEAGASVKVLRVEGSIVVVEPEADAAPEADAGI